VARDPGVTTPVAPTPTVTGARALVEALHQGHEPAREELRDWLRDPLRKLLHELQQRHQLDHNLDRMVRHALHAAETYLRTRPLQQFDRLSLPALRSALLLHVGKQALQPFGGVRTTALNGGHGPIHTPEPLPEHDVYHCKTYFLPYEKIGSLWFGGDWYGGHHADDGALWVIVADITGHGYYAYLLANTLPSVWQACWRDPRRSRQQPTQVLLALHELLAPSLPDGVYVECTLLRLEANGQVTVAPAGGTRLLLRRCGDNVLTLVRLRGFWLGMEPPRSEDQMTYTLAEGDELLIGTDGFFDQLVDYHGMSNDLAVSIAAHLPEGTLLEATATALQTALRSRPQRDDITMVTVHRKPRTPEQS